MAGQGPLPRSQHQRPRDTRRRQAGTVELTADEITRGPALPASIADPHPETVEWWDTWRRSPQAQVFAETDWAGLKRAALLHDQVWKSPKPSAAAVTELRLIEERYGATYVDRLRAKMHIASEGTGSAEVLHLRPVRNDSIRDRLAGSTIHHADEDPAPF